MNSSKSDSYIRAEGIRTIAIYTHADAASQHVTEADDSVLLPGGDAKGYLNGYLLSYFYISFCSLSIHYLDHRASVIHKLACALYLMNLKLFFRLLQ